MYTDDTGLFRRLVQKFGYESNRNLYWSCRNEKNFGDMVGPWLFEKISGTQPLFCMPTQLIAGHVNFTVGSIIKWILKPNVVDVWGSGIMNKNTVCKAPRHVYAVRGPHTRARLQSLGFECPEVYGDPALLLPKYIQSASPSKSHDVGLIPHFVDLPLFKAKFQFDSRIRLIDVCAPLEQVINEIRSCNFVASSSLHGIIVAHAFGIPAVRLILSDLIGGDGIKFDDYIDSFGGVCRVRTIELPVSVSTDEFMRQVIKDDQAPDTTYLVNGLLASCPFMHN